MTAPKTATTILKKPLFATLIHGLNGMEIETVQLQPGALLRNVYTREKDSGPVTTFEVFDGASSWYRYRTYEEMGGRVLAVYAPRGSETLRDSSGEVHVAKSLVKTKPVSRS